MDYFQPLKNLLKIIKFHGGVYRTLRQIYIMDTSKIGHFVGEDQFGNRYYENNYYFLCRNRWVIYSPKVGLDYDATQISCEYFNWLHHITDIPPHCDPNRKSYPWMLPHTQNFTGTKLEYVPYSTVRPKIEPWVPRKAPQLPPPSTEPKGPCH